MLRIAEQGAAITRLWLAIRSLSETVDPLQIRLATYKSEAVHP